MKKLVFIVLFMLTLGVSAQEIGIRFGEVARNNVAVDGIIPTQGSRIHANISFGDDGVGLDALWDFVYASLGEEALMWYAGFGPSASIGGDDFYLGASGEIGLEYRFGSIPIVIGADYRPTFWIVEETDWEWGGFGLNIRWDFSSN